MFSLSMWSLCICPLENEIDGTAFLELTDADIKGLVPKLGVVKKICRLLSSVSFNNVLHCVAKKSKLILPPYSCHRGRTRGSGVVRPSLGLSVDIAIMVV